MAPLLRDRSSTVCIDTLPWERLSQSWIRYPSITVWRSSMTVLGVIVWLSSPPAKVTTFITEPGSYGWLTARSRKFAMSLWP